MSTRALVRRIDMPAPVTGGGSQELGDAAGEQLGAPVVPLPHPTGLTVESTGIRYVAGGAPGGYANISWTPGAGTPPRATYEVQQATDDTFTTQAETNPCNATRASVNGRGGVRYWLRVRAVLDRAPGPWSASVYADLPADGVAPDAPTGVSAAFATDGTLEVRATAPTSSNFHHIAVRVLDAAGTVELDTGEFVTGLWTWSPARNRQQMGGSNYATAVQVELKAMSWAGVASGAITVSAASAAPDTPAGLSHTWSADASAGTAAADLVVTHTVVSGLRYYLSVDSVEREITPGRYPYPLAQNALEHSGTPDPALSLSLVAENGLAQRSAAPATATATNAAPQTAAAVTVTGGWSTMAIALTPPSPLPADLRDYRVRVYRAGSLVKTLWPTETFLSVRAESGDGTYTADVTPYDAFGQAGPASAQSAGVALVDDAAFAASLRSGAQYRDSIGTAAATLKAALADGNRASGGQSYASGSTWKSTDVWRELSDRYQPILITATAGVGYVGVTSDAVPTGSSVWRWFSGPLGADGVTLTEVASEAAAQSAAVSLPTSATGKYELSSLVEGRTVRLGHRNTGASYTLRELYADRVIEGDLIRSGSILTRALGAGVVSADKIAAGALDAFQITSPNIRTAASGARYTLTNAGFQAYDASNVVRTQLDLDGLVTRDSAGNVQVEATTATNGALTWGGRNGYADRLGMRLRVPSASYYATSTYGFELDDAGTLRDLGGLRAYVDSTTAYEQLRCYAPIGAARGVDLLLTAETASATQRRSRVQITASNGYGAASLTLQRTSAGVSEATINCGLNVGSATGAEAAGEVRASGAIHPPRSSGSALFGVDGTSQGDELTIAAGDVAYPFGNSNNFAGLLQVWSTDYGAALVWCSSNTSVLLANPASTYTVTSGTASRINVYVTAGGAVAIQNNTGAPRTFNISAWRGGAYE